MRDTTNELWDAINYDTGNWVDDINNMLIQKNKLVDEGKFSLDDWQSVIYEQMEAIWEGGCDGTIVVFENGDTSWTIIRGIECDYDEMTTFFRSIKTMQHVKDFNIRILT